MHLQLLHVHHYSGVDKRQGGRGAVAQADRHT